MMCRLRIETPQKYGEPVLEWQDIEVPDGEELPAGAVALPVDYDPARHSFDEVAGAFAEDPAKAEAIALARVEEKQERAIGAVARLTVAIAERDVWRQVQDLKRVTDQELAEMTAPQRQARWPDLIALMTESGTPMANFRQFAATAETELAPRVAAMATLSARALLARRAVKDAATAGAKLAAADTYLEAGA